MNKAIIAIGILILIFAVGCSNQKYHTKTELLGNDDSSSAINTSIFQSPAKNLSSRYIEIIQSNNEPSYKYNIELNMTFCHQVTCDCARNTRTPCMAFCFVCGPENETKSAPITDGQYNSFNLSANPRLLRSSYIRVTLPEIKGLKTQNYSYYAINRSACNSVPCDQNYDCYVCDTEVKNGR